MLFLGAGASSGARNRIGASLPNAYQLRNRLWRRLKHDPREPFDPGDLGLMSLEHAAAIIEAKTGRYAISLLLQEIFDCEKPLWQHIVLPHLMPRSIFTTNYDELVELGFAGNGRIVDVICSDRQPASGKCALFKPHGSLSHANQPIGQGGLVITQFDYFEMIAEYRQMLRKSMSEFGTKCVLVIGYSFGDMDIGSELYRIRKDRDDIPWYAVFPRADPHVKDMYYKKLGIRQINRTLEEFLTELDKAVDFIPPQFKFSQMADLVAKATIQAN